MNMKINTESIAKAAAAITTQNINIREVFSASVSDAESMEEVWKGAASEAAVSAFRAYAKAHQKEIEESLNEYTAFLQTAADAGYRSAEARNTSLADQI